MSNVEEAYPIGSGRARVRRSREELRARQQVVAVKEICLAELKRLYRLNKLNEELHQLRLEMEEDFRSLDRIMQDPSTPILISPPPTDLTTGPANTIRPTRGMMTGRSSRISTLFQLTSSCCNGSTNPEQSMNV